MEYKSSSTYWKKMNQICFCFFYIYVNMLIKSFHCWGLTKLKGLCLHCILSIPNAKEMNKDGSFTHTHTHFPIQVSSFSTIMPIERKLIYIEWSTLPWLEGYFWDIADTYVHAMIRPFHWFPLFILARQGVSWKMCSLFLELCTIKTKK